MQRYQSDELLTRLLCSRPSWSRLAWWLIGLRQKIGEEGNKTTRKILDKPFPKITRVHTNRYRLAHISKWTLITQSYLLIREVKIREAERYQTNVSFPTRLLLTRAASRCVCGLLREWCVPLWRQARSSTRFRKDEYKSLQVKNK